MDSLFEAWNLAINALVAVAMIVHFLAKKTLGERLWFLVVVAGFFAVLYVFQENWFVAQTFVVVWVILSGMELMVSRTVLMAMLACVLLLSLSSPVFYFAAVIFYTIILGGFIISSIRVLAKAAPKGLE